MDQLDDEIMRFVLDHRTRTFTDVATTVQAVGDSPWLLTPLALVALGVVAAARAWRVGLAAVAAAGVATLLARVLKELLERPRPGLDLALIPVGGWAMPSTHAARIAALTVATMVALDLAPSGGRRALVAALVCGNVLVGVLMVYLGAHWPTDVVAGWALGGVVGVALGWLARRRRASPA